MDDSNFDTTSDMSKIGNHVVANGDREIFIFPVQLIMGKIGNLTRLILLLLLVCCC